MVLPSTFLEVDKARLPKSDRPCAAQLPFLHLATWDRPRAGPQKNLHREPQPAVNWRGATRIAVGRVCPYLCFLAKVVPRGEIFISRFIFINPSDPKHVVSLLRCSDGLGVLVTAGIGHLGVF